MSEASEQLSWLVRDPTNQIRGPFRHAEILNFLKRGQLKGKTEIARANSYWFGVEEKGEIARFFPELGGGRLEEPQPTQLTATLTEADIREHGLEPTQFTSVSKEQEKIKQDVEGQIEWLSDEFAEEFGDGLAVDLPEPTQGQVGDEEEKKRQDILRRATVKADTLPSELHDFNGDTPKPIDSMLRASVAPSKSKESAIVTVPVEPDPTPKILTEPAGGSEKGKFWLIGGGLVVVGAIIAAGILISRPQRVFPAKSLSRAEKRSAQITDALPLAKRSLLLLDLEGAKGAISDLENDPRTQGEASTYLAQAVLKKEFLYDVDGALVSLQAARSKSRGARALLELDNLQAIYSFDREPDSALDILKKNSDSSGDPQLRYNYALGLLRAKRPAHAIPLLSDLLSPAGSDPYLAELVPFTFAWAIEAQCAQAQKGAACKGQSEAEPAYQRALSVNNDFSKARLGLALYRLRQSGPRAAEGDFRAFLDLAPDLDVPNKIPNFRLLNEQEFYAFAHAQIVELNTPGPNTNRPSPIIMAADAVVSALQNRTSEAGKILEQALSAAPGDPSVMKALAYLRWKENKLDEVIDALRGLNEKNSYAVRLMLGKAFTKQNKRDLAERQLRSLAASFSNRSEPHALLGELLAEQAELNSEARSELQTAIKRDPLDLVAWRTIVRHTPETRLPAELLKNLPF